MLTRWLCFVGETLSVTAPPYMWTAWRAVCDLCYLDNTHSCLLSAVCVCVFACACVHAGRSLHLHESKPAAAKVEDWREMAPISKQIQCIISLFPLNTPLNRQLWGVEEERKRERKREEKREGERKALPGQLATQLINLSWRLCERFD